MLCRLPFWPGPIILWCNAQLSQTFSPSDLDSSTYGFGGSGSQLEPKSPKPTRSIAQSSSAPSSEWDLASQSASQKVSSSGKDSDTSYLAEDFVLSDEDAGDRRADAINVLANLDTMSSSNNYAVVGPNYVR